MRRKTDDAIGFLFAEHSSRLAARKRAPRYSQHLDYHRSCDLGTLRSHSIIWSTTEAAALGLSVRCAA